MSWIRLGTAASMAGAVIMTTPASAGREFNERSIKGTWVLSIEGFVAEGSINPLAPAGTPLFAIARVIFDGEGGCRSDDQLVVGDQAVPPIAEDPLDSSDRRSALSCVYQVEPDGYGSFTVEYPDLADGTTFTTARFIVVDQTQINVIASNDVFGIFGGGVLTRQSRSRR